MTTDHDVSDLDAPTDADLAKARKRIDHLMAPWCNPTMDSRDRITCARDADQAGWARTFATGPSSAWCSLPFLARQIRALNVVADELLAQVEANQS